jgi:iron complex outermembrane receptor protein
MTTRSLCQCGVAALVAIGSSSVHAQTASPAQAVPALKEYLEVVATRIAETPDEVPAAIEVFGGDELRRRGATDLASALKLATGVDVTPGGDGGPAASVPEFWGLREFDAFLLVVDDVPWGGAFNPALTSLSLEDVERIEVLRGPAPVTYGATSFVGVIHVVHRQAGDTSSDARTRVGSFASIGGALATRLQLPWDSRLVVDTDRQGFRDDRTSFLRGHVSWNNLHAWDQGRVWFSADTTILDQDPASPHPREGPQLSSSVPLDANHNPEGAFLNERRLAFAFGFDRRSSARTWTSTASFTRGTQDILRGFLTGVSDRPDNARGLREEITQVDFYADTHLAWTSQARLRLVVGADVLHGTGQARGADFDYTAPLSGAFAPAVTVPTDLDVRIEDRRDFLGGYTLVEWSATPRLRVSGGVRLNVTDEGRERGDAAEQEASGSDEEHGRTDVRPSGSLGIVFTPWQRQADRFRLYANYRDTFKPAAADFNLGEGEGESEAGEGPLKPETSRSVEACAKLRTLRGRLWIDAGAFLMDFENLVVARTVAGLPSLMNAGQERFKGVEVGAVAQIAAALSGRASYSFHDARFRSFVFEFDGVPTELAGKRLEMSAQHLLSGGLLYARNPGLLATLEVKYVGSRYLNKRNTALADGYAAVDASIGYRFGRYEVRLDGRNLGDVRPPVAESELGDAQYYRFPARRLDVSVSTRF